MKSKKDKTKYLLEKSLTCKNCGSENIENYCSSCGQKIYIKRFTLKNFFHVFLDAFNIEKGFIHTLILLFTKPGVIINDYIKGKTKSYYNPLKYVLILAGINAIIIIWFDVLDTAQELFLNGNDTLQNNENALQFQQKIMNIVKQNLNFIPLLVFPFFGIASKWFNRSKKLFYGEHLIIYCFFVAQIFVISTVISPILAVFPSLTSYFIFIMYFLSIIYLSYVLYNTFHDSPVISVLKAISIYVIGFLLFAIFLWSVVLISLIILIKTGFIDITQFS